MPLMPLQPTPGQPYSPHPADLYVDTSAVWRDSTGTSLVSPGGGVRRTAPLNVTNMRVIEMFAPMNNKVISGQVTGAATAVANTSVGTSGKTPYGRAAWRLTTEAVAGSTAGVRVVQSPYGRLRSMGPLDMTKPIVVVVYPHSVNNGSRLQVHFSATNVATGSTRITYDQYITSLRTTGEVYPPVIPLVLNLTNGYPYGTGVTGVEFLQSMQIDAYQETGSAGITDITILGVYQCAHRPQVHISFDDGFKSVYDNAFPIMQARGLVGAVNLTGSLNRPTAGERQAYENLPMLIKPETDALLDAGWEMCVHGTIAIAAGSYAATAARVLGYRNDVRALGARYEDSSMFFAYPGGQLDNTLDADNEPVGFKALAAAGFVHATRTGGGRWSDALAGLGATSQFQSTLAVNWLTAPRATMYETADTVAATTAFTQQLAETAAGSGFFEFFTHSVVPRTFINGGQPHVAENPAWTGVMSLTNDISIELFTDYMDLLAMWQNLGIIEVVRKRDWWAGVPGGGVSRSTARELWLP